jgi:predicted nucleic acid-binding protein
MTLLIDTDVAIGALIGRPADFAFVRETSRRDLSISVVSMAELVEGVRNSATPKNDELELRKFLRGVRVRVVNARIAERSGTIRAELRRANRQIAHRTLDIFIAATAIEHDLTLVTRNVKDYRDIPGLRLYSWEKGDPV